MSGQWKTARLGEVCSRLSSGKGISAKEISEKGEYPVYGGNGLRGYTNHFNFEGECGIIGRQGAYCGNVRFFNGKGYMTEHAVVMCANKYNDTRFLAYLLSIMKLGRLSGQSAQPGLAVGTIAQQELKLPPLPVQRRIAAVLSPLDRKIELNARVNGALERAARALFKSRFVDASRAALPAGWREGRLGNVIAYIESGSRPKGGAEKSGVPSIGAENIERFGVYDYSKDKFISESFFASLKRGIVQSGDVLLYKDGAYTGKVSMALDSFPHERCAVNEHVFILRTEGKRFQFALYFTLLRNDIRERIATLAAGKAAQPGLNQGELCSVPIVIPPQDELLAFDRFVSPLMHMIAHNATESRALARLRDALLAAPHVGQGGCKPGDAAHHRTNHLRDKP